MGGGGGCCFYFQREFDVSEERHSSAASCLCLPCPCFVEVIISAQTHIQGTGDEAAAGGHCSRCYFRAIPLTRAARDDVMYRSHHINWLLGF
jgi:hypothetical protein